MLPLLHQRPNGLINNKKRVVFVKISLPITNFCKLPPDKEAAALSKVGVLTSNSETISFVFLLHYQN